MSVSSFAAPISAASSYLGLNSNSSKLFPAKDTITWSRKTVSNGSKTYCMKTWNPIDNKKFETLSYLPLLSAESITKEVGYVHRENSSMPGYYDGRYWTLWKLPMFGCNDSSQVLNEIQECKKAYPNAFIRCLAFDNVKQTQCMAFLIQKPAA
ncbi:hypothetical protein K7X08_005584 [Anisodus acutangulus]|uniref:Ribulose bisphosphate carboxylase small subunit, chloroplastic n=1 Tax=Anisodus acutangulus TaxID=402998 RepID=A0A9Q1LRJ4_9SOLA|nr:hypothetical protein K7X08_005584 [Anisodus acutangulus]